MLPSHDRAFSGYTIPGLVRDDFLGLPVHNHRSRTPVTRAHCFVHGKKGNPVQKALFTCAYTLIRSTYTCKQRFSLAALEEQGSAVECQNETETRICICVFMYYMPCPAYPVYELTTPPLPPEKHLLVPIYSLVPRKHYGNNNNNTTVYHSGYHDSITLALLLREFLYFQHLPLKPGLHFS